MLLIIFVMSHLAYCILSTHVFKVKGELRETFLVVSNFAHIVNHSGKDQHFSQELLSLSF